MNLRISTKSNLTKRVFAGLIDYSIFIIFEFSLIILLTTKVMDGHRTGDAIILPIIAILWFLIFVFTEQIIGATLGNKIMGLKSVSLKNPNEPISGIQSIQRHILDVVDYASFGITSVVLIKKTPLNQRLGDMWANTVVIDKNDNSQFVFSDQ